MISLKSYIKELLSKHEDEKHILNSTSYDQFYAENKVEIDAKILEMWDQYKFEQKQPQNNTQHFSTN